MLCNYLVKSCLRLLALFLSPVESSNFFPFASIFPFLSMFFED
jgi:hypothetical protein